MHLLLVKADRLSADVIGAAIEEHPFIGPGLLDGFWYPEQARVEQKDAKVTKREGRGLSGQARRRGGIHGDIAELQFALEVNRLPWRFDVRRMHGDTDKTLRAVL